MGVGQLAAYKLYVAPEKKKVTMVNKITKYILWHERCYAVLVPLDHAGVKILIPFGQHIGSHTFHGIPHEKLWILVSWNLKINRCWTVCLPSILTNLLCIEVKRLQDNKITITRWIKYNGEVYQ